MLADPRTDSDEEPMLAPGGVESGPPARRRLPVWLRAGRPGWTWIGIGIVGAGFVLIFIAWGQIAGEAEVYRQLPYLASAGLTGLALVLVGVTIINVAARQRDGIDRDRQIEQLVGIMEELKAVLTEGRRGRR